MTVLETLTAAAEYLRKHAVESSRLNAEHLLAHVLGQKRLDLYMQFDRPLSDAERAPLRDLVRQRGNGTPLQHLLGTAEFMGHTFVSDARALIPRPETEQLIEAILARGPFRQILDVGTGSGVIAISLALALPEASVTATDLSPDALALARENAAKLSAAVSFHQADLLPSSEDRFDLIAANLPYIPAAEIPQLQREVQFDPVTALDGGSEGLDVIARLIPAAISRLSTRGTLALEFGQGQAAAVTDLLKEHNYGDIQVLRDYQEIERFVLASYG